MSVEPVVPSELLVDWSLDVVLKLYGWNFVGFIFSNILLGILTVQTYFYFKKFNDNRFTRGLVLIMVAAEYCMILSQGQAFYSGLITSAGKPLPLLRVLTIRSTVLFSVGILQSSIVQAFFLVRIWALSRSMWKTTVVLVTVANQIAWGLALIVIWNENKLTDPLQGRLYVVLIAWVISEIVADVSVAAMLSFLLYTKKSRNGVASTNSLLNKLILYTVSTGAITAFVSLLIAVSILRKDVPFLGLVGEPYAAFFPLVMLANLHSRTKVQKWDMKVRQGGNHVTYKSGTRPSGPSTKHVGAIEMSTMGGFSMIGRSSEQSRPHGTEGIMDIRLPHHHGPTSYSQVRSGGTVTEYTSAIEISVLRSEETDYCPASGP